MALCMPSSHLVCRPPTLHYPSSLSTTREMTRCLLLASPPRCSYYMSLGILCGLILAAMPWAATGLSNQLGRARKENVSFAQLFRCVLTRRAASLLQRGMRLLFNGKCGGHLHPRAPPSPPPCIAGTNPT